MSGRLLMLGSSSTCDHACDDFNIITGCLNGRKGRLLTCGASVRWNSRVSIAMAVGTLIFASCCPRQFLQKAWQDQLVRQCGICICYAAEIA